MLCNVNFFYNLAAPKGITPYISRYFRNTYNFIMRKKRVSIKDIAADLNISVTTVSFVLNGKAEEKHISKQLTKKVLDYVEKVNYRPNQVAQSLRTGESKILVFMVEDIANSFFAKLARLIEDLAYKKGYKVLFCSNDNDDDKSKELIHLFKNRQVDGFIIVPSPNIQNTIANLIEEKIPVLLFDRYYPELNTNYVVTNNAQATQNAIDHLVSNGFENIAYITLDTHQSQMEDRLDGYTHAIKEHGLKEISLKLPFSKTISDQGDQEIKAFLEKHPEIDAILFATNYLTETGLEVIKGNFPGLIDRIGFITFDDSHLFKTYSPSITAVAQPTVEMAEKAMEIILKLLKSDKELPTQKVVLESSLIVRDSSKKRLQKS